jgi:hypothetical protein
MRKSGLIARYVRGSADNQNAGMPAVREINQLAPLAYTDVVGERTPHPVRLT